MKTIAMLLLLLTATTLLLTGAAHAAAPKPQVKQLEIGTVQIYDFGAVKLHAYETKDPLADESFLLETAGGLVGIESPAFHGNLKEYADYVKTLGKPLRHLLISYHAAGGGYYGGVKVYGTEASKASQGEGGSGKGLIDSFTQVFGAAFDGKIIQTTDIVAPGKAQIGGVDFTIIAAHDGYDVEIPAINSIYTHMFGAKVHNILTSVPQIDAMIAQVKGYQAKNYNLILSSHHTPETIDAAAAKLDYLEKAKKFAQTAKNGADFMSKMKEAFPDYEGVNYLEMSAGALFGGK